MRQIVLDTETTGLRANDGDRIIEIGCVELVNRQFTGNEYHCFINPERDIPKDAVEIHGLTQEFLEDKPLFKEIVSDFCAFIKGTELIIHNASFDVGFINAEFSRLQLPPVEHITTGIIDSLQLAKKSFPGRKNSLDVLCTRFGINNSERTKHGALIDATLLAKVYLALTRGQKSLAIEEDNVIFARKDQTNHFSPNIKLIVKKASLEEEALHNAYLDEMQAALKDDSVIWRR